MLFSIITPAFKQTDWLRLCIASVADQVGEGVKSALRPIADGSLLIDGKAAVGVNCQQSAINNSESPLEIEHLIQDGGTPGIVEFVVGLAGELGLTILPSQEGESLRASKPGYALILVSEADGGMYDAINRGISHMRGDLWAWLNCDEQYLPGTLEYAAQWFAKHSETDILCGDALLVDDEGRALSYRRIIRPNWHHTRLVHLASLSCASFYRRSVVSLAGIFDTTWRAIGDAEWMARLLRSGLRVDVCRKLLSSFAFTGQNTSESPLAGQEGMKWRESPDAPPSWLTIPVTLHHRIRKLLAASYEIRTVSYALHQKSGAGRIERTARGIGWSWPGSTGEEQKRDSGASNQRTVPVLGTALAVTNYADLSRKLVELVDTGVGPLAVDFANTHVITLRRHDPQFAALTRSIDVTVPDGMPLVWVMNRRGAGLTDRVYGPTFTRKFLESCPEGKTHYLVGGSAECGEKFRERMLALNPSLQFIGSYHGGSSAGGVLEDDEAVLNEIREKRPHFIWAGLGTPKQYAWIARMKPKLDHGILLAVGFAFDVNAGTKTDTPDWMQRLGLGWLHRMASEPKRLVGRYLKYNSLFLWYLLREELGGKDAAISNQQSTIGNQQSQAGEKSEKSEIPERKLVTSAHKPDSMKLYVRNWLLKFSDLFATDIIDCVSGRKLGRGLLIGYGRWTQLIGYQGRPLLPKFVMQKRLTYWKQKLGFTAQPTPNYTRLRVASPMKKSEHPRVLNLLLAHQGGEGFEKLRRLWSPICAEENLWVAFGGSREEFDALDYPRKVLIDDSGLRVRDQQREKQSYGGILRAMAPIVEREAPDFIYLCEYDHIPLIADLNERQVEEITREGADVMGHWLYRIDGTGHYHQLYHEADPEFLPFWKSLSRRDDPTVVLSMFGSGSFWTREAFLAVAERQQTIECYLELYLPTLAHHLGFRVREWDENRHLISNIPVPEVTREKALSYSCWTVHPVKELLLRKLIADC